MLDLGFKGLGIRVLGLRFGGLAFKVVGLGFFRFRVWR